MALYLNQFGIINALGNTCTEVAKRIFVNEPQSGLTERQDLFSGRSTLVGRVNSVLPEIPTALKHYDCRTNQLLFAAIQPFEEDLRKFIGEIGKDNVGVVLGTSTSGITEGEAFCRGEITEQELNYQKQEIGNCSQFLGDYLGIEGIRFTISTACTSSARAFISAQRLIEAGLCQAVIVGGSDSLCDLTVNGFDCLESISPSLCNPFSQNRCGINIGEGAAIFVVSQKPSALRFLSGADSSDGYHFSAPDPSGKGARMVMEQALEKAQLSANDIGYLNLHGTATKKNDLMEGQVVQAIFAHKTPMSSTKPFIGHTLGAAGAQELAICCLTLLKEYNPERRLPLHLWDGEMDREIDAMPFVTAKDRLEKDFCMSSSFAFGGNNVCLIIGKASEING